MTVIGGVRFQCFSCNLKFCFGPESGCFSPEKVNDVINRRHFPKGTSSENFMKMPQV